MTAVAARTPLAERLGTHRALSPAGTLPHLAEVLDARSPAGAHELELDVLRLGIDATSFAALRERCGADPERMAQTIGSIVARHGKLQNPWTGSGGVLLGRVRRAGPERREGLRAGELVVPLASLIAIPLVLEEVGPVDPADPQVPVRGRAIVTGGITCARPPADLPAHVSLAVLDVYPAASHARRLAATRQTVLVLGAGHAGLLAIAAARDALGEEGTIVAVDRSAAALERAQRVDPGAVAIEADLTDPLALAGHELAPADLTLQCAAVAGAEGVALVATAPRGTIVFFSTATTFAAAGLGADAVGSQARLLIPAGLTDDRGDYAFSLLRANPELRRAFGA